MKAPERLVTTRLVLRRRRDSDVAPMAKLNGDPEVMRFFSRTVTPEETRQRIAHAARAMDTRGYALWAVELPGVAPCIGLVGPAQVGEELPFAGAIEIAWRLDKPFWGQGYAAEAARAALADVFARIAPDEVIAYAAASNTPSLRVMEKLGMREDPAARFDHPAHEAGDPRRAHVVYRIGRDEFLAGARGA